MSWASAKYYRTGYSADQVPDLTGKVAIVTGGNTGLGYETVLTLASKGAHVFMASRSPERAQAALLRLRGEIGAEAAARVEVLPLDLQDLKQTQRAAREFLDKGLPLHILVNNAGIMACPFGLTRDGVETQMGTNHLGHFALTLAVLPALKAGAPGSRVVNLSSFGHCFAPPEGIVFDKINDESALTPWERYGQSKLANILFTTEFNKRYGNQGIYANANHPGFVKTELIRGPQELYGMGSGCFGMFKQKTWDIFEWMSCIGPKDGVLTQIYLATSPDVVEKGIKGKYFVPFAKQFDGVTPAAKNEELADELWRWSEKVLKEQQL